MTNLTGVERAHYVQKMFGQIAPHYDLMNRLMTVGQDTRWRQTVIRRAALPPDGWLLDLGAGTGDLAYLARQEFPGLHTIAADFTLGMMQVGKKRISNGSFLSASDPPASTGLSWSGADASQLPFPNHRFDAIVSGFLLRNVVDLPRSLNEQHRVLKPGGRLVALDTSPPPRSPLAPLLRFHLHTVIPSLGKLITGQEDAYRYLPDSTENFLEPEQMAVRLEKAGFIRVGFERRMFGTIAIYWGIKP